MSKCKTSAEVGGMGHSVKRKEDPRFIRGQGNYVDDVVRPGMVFMDIVRSPYAHAKIKSINTEKALAHPGVAAVITGETLKEYNLHMMPTLMSDSQMVLLIERSEEHTSELQSLVNLVCRLLLEKKNINYIFIFFYVPHLFHLLF